MRRPRRLTVRTSPLGAKMRDRLPSGVLLVKDLGHLNRSRAIYRPRSGRAIYPRTLGPFGLPCRHHHALQLVLPWQPAIRSKRLHEPSHPYCLPGPILRQVSNCRWWSLRFPTVYLPENHFLAVRLYPGRYHAAGAGLIAQLQSLSLRVSHLHSLNLERPPDGSAIARQPTAHLSQ